MTLYIKSFSHVLESTGYYADLDFTCNNKKIFLTSDCIYKKYKVDESLYNFEFTTERDITDFALSLANNVCSNEISEKGYCKSFEYLQKNNLPLSSFEELFLILNKICEYNCDLYLIVVCGAKYSKKLYNDFLAYQVLANDSLHEKEYTFYLSLMEAFEFASKDGLIIFKRY